MESLPEEMIDEVVKHLPPSCYPQSQLIDCRFYRACRRQVVTITPSKEGEVFDHHQRTPHVGCFDG